MADSTLPPADYGEEGPSPEVLQNAPQETQSSSLPSAPPGWSENSEPPDTSIGSAAKQGFIRSLHDVGQSTDYMASVARQGKLQTGETGRPMEPAPWLEEPLEYADFKHPFKRLAPKFAYQFGEAFPTTLGGLAGAGVGATFGTATEPGGGTAVGTLIGGAIGAAAANIVQKMGPYYAQAIQRNPGDPDKAFEEAWKEVGLSGGLTAASWAAFGGMNPFKNAAKNMLAQAFAIQPTLTAGAQVGQNVIEGRPATEGLADAYMQGILGTASPAVGFGVVGKLARETSHRLTEKLDPSGRSLSEPPEWHQMQQSARDMYHSADSAGPIPHVDTLTQKKNEIHEALLDAKADPEYDSEIFKIVDRLDQGRGGRPVDAADLARAKVELGDLAWNAPKANTRRLAGIAKRRVAGIIQNEDALQELGYHPLVAAGTANLYKFADGMERMWRPAKAFADMREEVHASVNPDKGEAWRDVFRKELSDPEGANEKFGPEVVQAMKSIRDHGPGQLQEWMNSLPPLLSHTGLMATFLLDNVLPDSPASKAWGAALGIDDLLRRSSSRDVVKAAEQIGKDIRWKSIPGGKPKNQRIVSPVGTLIRPDVRVSGRAPVHQIATQITSPAQQLQGLQPTSDEGIGQAKGGAVQRALALSRRR